ncbi:Hypothetical predicted protein [Podarcis lilfordi]|uniref:Uncharacterized protein n=1 Tax=Podarcis lilfordi TaxID=74358 RepID=A0AA35QRG3_9SAUR|nr:Hypothetical predicted protein [Podarcis lilfordi]
MCDFPTCNLFQDANSSGSSAIPAIVTDALANGDQRTPLETRRQLEAASSPLPLDAVAKEEKDEHREEKDGQGAKEQEQKNAKQTQGANSEMEKMRLDFELTLLKRQHEENDKQRQHEEKMENIRQHLPCRTPGQGDEEQLGSKLDPITEIELEKMRMEFELAKLKQISEENERQRQHERKMYEDKEKQRQHEETMEKLRLRQGNIRVLGPKATGSKAEAAAESFSETFGEVGKMRIELQLAMEVYLPDVTEKKPHSEPSGQQEGPKPEQPLEKILEAGRPPVPPEQKTEEVTEHLGLQVPRIVVSGAESEWSSSRLDLAIETELEKRRMEFELTRLKYEHEENERQRQHEEKMEQLRQQQAPPKESE